MLNNKRCFLLIVFALFVLTACSRSGDGVEPPAGRVPEYVPPQGATVSLLAHTGQTLHGHTLVAQNDNFLLFLYEPRLSVIIQHRQSGAYMRSTVDTSRDTDNHLWQGLYMSGVTLDYIVGINVHFSRACLYHTERYLTVYYREDGFSAQVFFPDIQIGYTLVVTLEDDGFTAEIPQASIVEYDPHVTVGAFYVFPFLGHSYMGGDEGYMFIPDGQGAIIKLQDNESRFNTPFNEPVFGSNPGLEIEVSPFMFSNFMFTIEPQTVIMPVYGMVHTGRGIGFLGVIESGYENAAIEAFPNGVSTDFDWISSRFTYSHVVQQPTGMQSGFISTRTQRPNRIDLRMRYIFVTGDQATYTGLAVAYREYLTNTGAFTSAKMDEYRTAVDFLGVEQREWALFRLNVSMTTFAQAEEILHTLAANGVDRVYTRFDGWTTRGSIYSLPTRGFNPAGTLGGQRGLNSLQNTVVELGGTLTLVVNPLDIVIETNTFEAFNAMRRVNGRTADFMGGSMRVTTPTRTLELSERVASELGTRGFAADVIRMTSFLSAYSEGGTYFDRADSAALFRQSAAAFDYHHEAPALTTSFAYLWRYASALTVMPSTGSGYLFNYKHVPFLSIATSGMIPVYFEHVNFQANQRRFFLNLVETGARPMFLITAEDAALLRHTLRNDIFSSMFDLYKDLIIQYHHELSYLHEHIGDASIVRRYAQDNTVRIQWSNGLWVYLNYGREEAVVNGITIGPMSYEIVV
ncbi:MAG: DUF5696 domain-containing protein [Defluviitaleaceae bacterium]|nr:DUF5696 domain-containing protein [Defluviitaleaceae bacterium]